VQDSVLKLTGAKGLGKKVTDLQGSAKKKNLYKASKKS
jgi:hypothetical protein